MTSAASPSAPSAAAENDVAIEKKMTVPPSAVARIAPCSQPGTSTQTTVTSAGAAQSALDGGRQRDRVAGVGEGDVVGQPDFAQQRGLALDGHDADGACARRRRGRRQRQRAGLARSADRRRPSAPAAARTYRSTTRAVSAGAPQTSMTAIASSLGQVVGEPCGDRAAEEDRGALGRHLLGAAVPARPARR